jgi:helix-turn-helix protein
VNSVNGVNLALPPEILEPLIRRVVEETLQRVEEIKAGLPDDRALSEAEAARFLAVNEHVLRDERRRGRITASRIVGRRIRYLRSDLIAYMLSRRQVNVP